jgi:hypothetical protein
VCVDGHTGKATKEMERSENKKKMLMKKKRKKGRRKGRRIHKSDRHEIAATTVSDSSGTKTPQTRGRIPWSQPLITVRLA